MSQHSTATEDRVDLVSDDEIATLGRSLWQAIRGQTPSLFDHNHWQGRLVEWAMREPSFKIDLFRFVDVLPTLESKEQVARHVEEYLLRPGRKLPLSITAALKVASTGFTAGLAAAALRRNVRGMAERFIVGTTANDAQDTLRRLHREGFRFTVDLLGESCLSEDEAERAIERYQQTINAISTAAQAWPGDEGRECDHLGPLPRANVSIKISAMYSQFEAADLPRAVGVLKERLLPLYLLAKQQNVFLNLDLEQWALHELTYSLFEELLCDNQLRDWRHVGIVVQAYLKSARRDVQRLLSLAQRRGTPLTVRLVKGAYWDYETVRARQQGWPCPVFADKAQTDQNYESITRTLLQNAELTVPAFGSHNLRSLSHALVAAKTYGLPSQAIELQMLYGMAEPERVALRDHGQRVRLYCPVGELIPGMAYLVRRLLENTSNQGFLRLTHHDNADVDSLLTAPSPQRPQTAETPITAERCFDNCPLSDFQQLERRQAISEAIDALSLPVDVPIVIEGKSYRGQQRHTHVCPSDASRQMTSVALASDEQVEQAVGAAEAGLRSWRSRPLIERAELLRALGQELQQQRDALAALICWEVGKPWREADADVAEAVDFCHYYAQQALVELQPRQQGSLPGETNTLLYEGRGVAAVIGSLELPRWQSSAG